MLKADTTARSNKGFFQAEGLDGLVRAFGPAFGSKRTFRPENHCFSLSFSKSLGLCPTSPISEKPLKIDGLRNRPLVSENCLSGVARATGVKIDRPSHLINGGTHHEVRWVGKRFSSPFTRIKCCSWIISTSRGVG